MNNEGWFDPWLFLQAFKKKITSMGVDFINAEVAGISVRDNKVQAAKVHNRQILFSYNLSKVHKSDFFRLFKYQVLKKNPYVVDILLTLVALGLPQWHGWLELVMALTPTPP